MAVFTRFRLYVLDLPDGGSRHVLPPYTHHKARVWGFVLIVIDVALVGGAGYLITLAWPDAFLAVLGGVGAVAGVVLLALGLRWALGRQAVVLTDESLFGVGRVGPLSWFGRQPLDRLGRRC